LTFVLVWDNRGMLSACTVLSRDGVEIADVAWRHARGASETGRAPSVLRHVLA
jgi:hypothetical protein